MSNKDGAPPAPKDEGPRAFSRTLQEMSDGDPHVEMSKEFHELTVKLLKHARATNTIAKGAFGLTLKLAVEPNGIVGMTYDIKTKEPPKPRGGSVFWTTKGGNLTAQNPKQAELFPRAVEARPVESVDEETGEIRGV